MDNKKKMKAMIKQMQSVIALVIIFVVASTICIKDGRNNFLDIRNLMNVLSRIRKWNHCNWYDDYSDPWRY